MKQNNKWKLNTKKMLLITLLPSFVIGVVVVSIALFDDLEDTGKTVKAKVIRYTSSEVKGGNIRETLIVETEDGQTIRIYDPSIHPRNYGTVTL